MKLLRSINKLSGIGTVLLFLLIAGNLIQTRNAEGNMPFYYMSWIFIVMGAVFLFTAVIFALYAVIRRVRQRRVRMMIRHYLYAAAGIYAVCLLLDYIINDELCWNYIFYALALALFQLYFSGYKFSHTPVKTHVKPSECD